MTGLLLAEVLLRLIGIRTPQSVFVISHVASLWSDVVSLPWKYLLDVLTHLLDYSFVGMFFVIGLFLLRGFTIEIIASGLGALVYACNATDTGLIEPLGRPFVLLVIAFVFEVLWLNPTIVADAPKLQGKMKPNLWVYVFLLEGILFFQKLGSRDNIFDEWGFLAEWIFWVAVAALSCLQAVMYSKLAGELWDAFKDTALYDAIRRFLIWVSRPWIAPPVKYAPPKPPDYFGTGGRLSSDPLNDQVMATGLVNDNDPENAPSVVYDKRKTNVIAARETLRLQ